MNEEVIAQVNPDVYTTREFQIKLIDGILYQYQWSCTENKFAWYIVPGQEDQLVPGQEDQL